MAEFLMFDKATGFHRFYRADRRRAGLSLCGALSLKKGGKDKKTKFEGGSWSDFPARFRGGGSR